MYTLLSVHTGKVKTNSNQLLYIDEVKNNDLLTFKTKKQAINFVRLKLCWALVPIKATHQQQKVHGKTQYYQFDLNN
jgi:hypothetical protein